MRWIGYNIHAQVLNDTARKTLNSHLQRLQPSALVVMDDTTYALQLAEMLPGCRVIARLSGDDNIQDRHTPAQVLDMYHALRNTPVWVYINNEPRADRAVFDWHEDVARLALQRNLRAVLGNWSVGVPEPGQWTNGDRLLPLVAANPDRLAIGLHEYAPDDWRIGQGWYMARYNHLLAWCRSHGVPIPRIVITEWGWDHIHTPTGRIGSRGIRDARHNWQVDDWQAHGARELIDAYNALYRHNETHVVGATIFSYGAATSQWATFDVSGLNRFAAGLEGLDHMSTPGSTQLAGFVSLNVRAAPGGEVIAVITGGTSVMLTSTPPVQATIAGTLYWWYECVLPSGRVGWFAVISSLVATPPLPSPDDFDTPDDGKMELFGYVMPPEYRVSVDEARVIARLLDYAADNPILHEHEHDAEAEVLHWLAEMVRVDIAARTGH